LWLLVWAWTWLWLYVWLYTLYYTVYRILAANLQSLSGAAVGVGWRLVVGCWLLAAGCWLLHSISAICHLQSAICNLPGLGWLLWLWLHSCLRWLALALNLACQPAPQPVNPASVTYKISFM
jgi:hypothetical protein